MKQRILLIFLTFMSIASSAPVVNDSDATIIEYDYQLKEDGYFFTYTTSNGITRQENAVLIRDPYAKDGDDKILRITGFYAYTDEANNFNRIDYVANENGYTTLKKRPSTPINIRISSATLASLGG